MKVTGTGLVAGRAADEVALEGRRLRLAKAELAPSLPPREARRLTRHALLALAACREALPVRLEGAGIAFGTGFGSVEATRLALEGLFERADLISPTHFVSSVRHDAAGVVARVLGLRGPQAATSARRLSFEQALGWALRQVRLGRAPAMLAAGADEMTPLLARALARGRLRGERVLHGEGAGALLLEPEESPRPALARIGRYVEGAGSIDDLLGALGEVKPELVFTDEDGGERRARDARRVAGAVGGEKVALAELTGHLAAGGALVAVEAVRSRRRALCYAREADGAFAAYVVEPA